MRQRQSVNRFAIPGAHTPNPYTALLAYLLNGILGILSAFFNLWYMFSLCKSTLSLWKMFDSILISLEIYMGWQLQKSILKIYLNYEQFNTYSEFEGVHFPHQGYQGIPSGLTCVFLPAHSSRCLPWVGCINVLPGDCTFWCHPPS